MPFLCVNAFALSSLQRQTCNCQAYSAYHILKGTQMPQSRYLFAISCFQMNILSEAEMALCPANEPSAEVPNGAAGHYLLGLIYSYIDRKTSAIHHFNQALSMNPLLWAAYEELCKLGASVEATTVFGESALKYIQKHYTSHDMATQLQASHDHIVVSGQHLAQSASTKHLKHLPGNIMKDPENHHGAILSENSSSQPYNGGHANMSVDNTPSPMTTQISGRLFSDSGPRRSTRLAGGAGSDANISGSTVAGNGKIHPKYPGSSKLRSAAFRLITVRKGQSLATECCDEGIRTDVDDSHLYTKTTSGSSFSPDGTCFELDGSMMSEAGASMSGSEVSSGASELLTLLRILGEGYRLSCLYKCQEALNVFLKLPHKHYNTGWVLSQVGKAHFELIDYLEAERAFNNSRLASPCSLEGMDIYSTVLYHLKEDMRLSYLAQELVSTDRLAPQSWCAMGNCYSVQKDHETALKNFQRAVQLDSRFSYAHTLCGHEYMALDDFENGIRSYQNALQIDARLYIAWYGLGMIYLRQERYELSEHHFRKAFQINPHSSVIMSYLGISLHALKAAIEKLHVPDEFEDNLQE